MKRRESAYDLLKIISVIAVITIHVTKEYFDANISESWIGDYPQKHLLTVSIYSAMSRFAVPCFVMISGALALDNEKNANYRYYYRKEFESIGIPTLLFSLCYFMFWMCIQVYKILVAGDDATILLEPVNSAIAGAPYYHMWYLYMMLAIYIMVPFLIRLKADIGERKFAIMSLIFFPLAIISLWTSTHKVNWDLGQSFCFMGYFLIGYTIRRCLSPKNNIKALGFIVLGTIGLGTVAIAMYFRYSQELNGVTNSVLMKHDLLGSGNPMIACGSVLLFVGFTKLKMGISFSKLANITLYIYLFHAGLWSLMGGVISPEWDSRIVIPVSVFLIFVLSMLCSIIYKWCWNFRISKRIGK